MACFLNITIWSKLQGNAHHPRNPSSALRKGSSREGTERNVLESLSSQDPCNQVASCQRSFQGGRILARTHPHGVQFQASFKSLTLSCSPPTSSAGEGELRAVCSPVRSLSQLPGIQAACSWNQSPDSSNFTIKGRCRSLVSEAGFAFPLSPPLVNIW